MSTPFDTVADSGIVQPTDSQLSFVRSLLDERDWQITDNVTYHARVAVIATALAHSYDAAGLNAYLLDANEPLLPRPGASKLIDWLKAQPVKARTEAVTPAASAPEVPAGRYAVATEDGAINALAFYKVDHGKGRWDGMTFVTLVLGGHQERPLGTGQAAKAVLRKIAADVEGAAAAYGHEMGRCGFCHLPLTNDVSRARGIGPDCAKKYL